MKEPLFKLLQITQYHRRLIMNICEACEQFKYRIKEWNFWSGAVDPLPYIDNVIKPHRHLMFEGRRPDGSGTHILVLHCLKCDQWWKLAAWPVFGCLEVLPYLTKDHSSHSKELLLAKKGVSSERKTST